MQAHKDSYWYERCVTGRWTCHFISLQYGRKLNWSKCRWCLLWRILNGERMHRKGANMTKQYVAESLVCPKSCCFILKSIKNFKKQLSASYSISMCLYILLGREQCKFWRLQTHTEMCLTARRHPPNEDSMSTKIVSNYLTFLISSDWMKSYSDA